MFLDKTIAVPFHSLDWSKQSGKVELLAGSLTVSGVSKSSGTRTQLYCQNRWLTLLPFPQESLTAWASMIVFSPAISEFQFLELIWLSSHRHLKKLQWVTKVFRHNTIDTSRPVDHHMFTASVVRNIGKNPFCPRERWKYSETLKNLSTSGSVQKLSVC